MRMREINVSDEYLEHLCEELLKWVEDPKSLTIPQFLAQKGIGYPYFKYFVYRSAQVCNTYEVVKAKLNSRWLEMGLGYREIPAHRCKMLMRYLRLYDSHALDIEQESRERVAEASAKAEVKYTLEKYERAELEEPYRGIYQSNVDKRRGGEKA